MVVVPQLTAQTYIDAATHALNPPQGADAELWLESDAPRVLAACVRAGLEVVISVRGYEMKLYGSSGGARLQLGGDAEWWQEMAPFIDDVEVVAR